MPKKDRILTEYSSSSRSSSSGNSSISISISGRSTNSGGNNMSNIRNSRNNDE